MFNIQKFSTTDIQEITAFMEEQCEGTQVDAYEFCEGLFEEAEEDAAFCRTIHEWLNGACTFTDFYVNGFSLQKLASVYDDPRVGVLIALHLLRLEKFPELRGICAYNALSCLADKRMIDKDVPCGYAELTEEGWYFLGKDLPYAQEDAAAMKVYDLWHVLIQNPFFIALLAIDHPVGTRILLKPDESGYEVFLPPENREVP